MKPTIGFSTDGQVFIKNRAWRRKRKTKADLDNKPKKFYTKKRRKNGH